MFESVAELGGALSALSEVRRARIELEDHELILVGWYADTCPPVPGGVERCYGSGGTPGVAEFAAAELGTVLATTTNAASTLIGDVLDLRHRLPLLWARVEAGVIPAWKARAVAKATRELSVAAAGLVDQAVVGLVTSQPWPRFQTTLDTAIITADSTGAEHRAAAWAADRFVRTGRTTGHGYQLLVARAAAGDVIWFDAMVSRIASILAAAGDTDPVQVRRSKAIGILAQPALALQLLVDHQDDIPDPDLPTEPGATPPPESMSEPEPRRESDPAGQSYRSVELTRPIVDPRAAAPKVVLHVHLSRDALTTRAGVAHLESLGPVTVEEVRRFLGTRDVRISVRPVLDPQTIVPVDAHDVPASMAEAVRQRNPVEVFPYGTCPARTPYGAADLDHTVAYLDPDHGGPPGQTRPDNLGPLSRHHHRAKTLGGWAVRQPESGVFLWRSPHGHVYTVDPTGTRGLGTGPYARAVWKAVRDLTASDPSTCAEVA